MFKMYDFIIDNAVTLLTNNNMHSDKKRQHHRSDKHSESKNHTSDRHIRSSNKHRSPRHSESKNYNSDKHSGSKNYNSDKHSESISDKPECKGKQTKTGGSIIKYYLPFDPTQTYLWAYQNPPDLSASLGVVPNIPVYIY